ADRRPLRERLDARPRTRAGVGRPPLVRAALLRRDRAPHRLGGDMTALDAPAVATGRTRAQALRAAVAGGAALGAAALAGAWTRPAASAGLASPAQDVRIMNFLLVLEEAQAAFYAAALRSGGLTGELLEFARVAAPQERQHVALLRRRLGDRAAAAPRLGFGDAVADPRTFRQTAIDLEEQTVAAYIGQGASLTA